MDTWATREFKEAIISGRFDNERDGPFTLCITFKKPSRRSEDGDFRFVLKDRKDRVLMESREISARWGDTITLIDIGKMLTLTIT
jgi:hypothetical protein